MNPNIYKSFVIPYRILLTTMLVITFAGQGQSARWANRQSSAGAFGWQCRQFR